MTSKKKLRPPVKTHGGKFYLTDFIIEHFPDNYEELTYVEPMCAGASVYLNKKPSKQEVISDIDAGVISIFKALRDEPKEFIDRLKKIKYAEKNFKLAYQKSDKEFTDYVDLAINEYILRRMSRGGMKKTFAWSERLRGGQPGDVNAWQTMLGELPRIADRVNNTIMLNRSVFDVMKIWDEENVLFYLDPPYLPSTRSDNALQVYDHELTSDEHFNLLQLAKNIRGKVMISGYSSSLYNKTLKGWRSRRKIMANHASQSKVKDKRTEVIWMNY